MMNTKRNKATDPDNPPLKAAQLREFRPISPKRRAMFRRAYINTFRREPPAMGRPPKGADEKYRDVHIRLHPTALTWAKHEARRRGIGYQTVINETLLRRAA